MSRVVKVKNTGALKTWVGVGVASGTYYEIPEVEIAEWRSDTEVFADVGSGRLIVNDGIDDFPTSTAGWGWLRGDKIDVIPNLVDPETGDTEPERTSPVTPDGEYHTIQSNLGKITGNEIVNWTMNYNLNTGTDVKERYVIPPGKTVSIEFVQGYSPSIPYSVELNWYVTRNGTTFRRNPAMRARDFIVARVDGDQSAPDTTIVLKNKANGFEFRDLEIDRAYEFLTSSGTKFIRTVTAKNGPSKTVTLDESIPSDLSNNDKIALVDRPIAKLGGDATNSLMDFEIAPTFRGNDERYLELVVKNESPTDAGEVFAVVNGWLTSTVSGTIPGAGGGESDEG